MTSKDILNTRLSTLFQDLDLDQSKISSVTGFIEFLLKVNKSVSITSFKNFDHWFVGHIEDCLKAYNIFISLNPKNYIDCGSGNGLPGVLFGILSDIPFILCDTDERKAEFLKTAVHRFNLKGKVLNKPISLIKYDDLSRGSFFLYRGLGPDEVLTENYKKSHDEAMHFRFKSVSQEVIFPNSSLKSYKLSDNSERFIEISSKSTT